MVSYPSPGHFISIQFIPFNSIYLMTFGIGIANIPSVLSHPTRRSGHSQCKWRKSVGKGRANFVMYGAVSASFLPYFNLPPNKQCPMVIVTHESSFSLYFWSVVPPIVTPQPESTACAFGNHPCSGTGSSPCGQLWKGMAVNHHPPLTGWEGTGPPRPWKCIEGGLVCAGGAS